MIAFDHGHHCQAWLALSSGALYVTQCNLKEGRNVCVLVREGVERHLVYLYKVQALWPKDLNFI